MSFYLSSMAKKEESTDSKYQELVQTIEKMSVLELSEFVKVLEEKFGVSAAAVAMPMAPMQAATGDAPAAAEKTSFNVVLKDAGASKIQVIKLVKDITGKGLTEAKDMAEKTPSIIKEGAKKEEAEDLKKKLEAVGATVVLE